MREVSGMSPDNFLFAATSPSAVGQDVHFLPLPFFTHCPIRLHMPSKKVMKRKSPPEQSMLMDKWSLKSKDHDANRVRNNQRRHRARVKSRIEELEIRLAETNANLEAALSTIGRLTSELEGLRAGRAWTGSHLEPPRTSEPASQVLDSDPQCLRIADRTQRPVMPASKIQESSCTPETAIDQIGPVVPASAAVENSAICDCLDGAPPPAQGESTMSCSSAFQIIEQQNFSGVEVTTIKAWLGPGFRLRPGEACRVETNKLYELIDHITSPSRS